LKFLKANIEVSEDFDIEQGMSNHEVSLRHSLFLVRYSAVQKSSQMERFTNVIDKLSGI